MHADPHAKLADEAAYIAAVENAKIRARYSFFPQHIVADPSLGYIAIDEGDCATMPANIIRTIPSARSDDLLEDLAMRLADPYWDEYARH